MKSKTTKKSRNHKSGSADSYIEKLNAKYQSLKVLPKNKIIQASTKLEGIKLMLNF